MNILELSHILPNHATTVPTAPQSGRGRDNNSNIISVQDDSQPNNSTSSPPPPDNDSLTLDNFLANIPHGTPIPVGGGGNIGPWNGDALVEGEFVCGLILILSSIVLTSILAWIHIHLIYYAPRTHAWNGITSVFAIDHRKDESQCRLGAVVLPANGSCTGNATASENSASNSVQCKNAVFFGTGLFQIVFYLGLCYGSAISLIWYLFKKDKMTECSFLTEFQLGLCFVVSCILLPVVVVRSIKELNGLKGDMALDCSPPDVISEFWLETQTTGKCCGIVGFGHWRVPIESENAYSYPLSCCDPMKASCNESSSLSSCDVWTEGCYKKEFRKLTSFAVGLITFLFIQLIFSIYGICLVAGIKARIDSRRIYINRGMVDVPRINRHRRRRHHSHDSQGRQTGANVDPTRNRDIGEESNNGGSASYTQPATHGSLSEAESELQRSESEYARRPSARRSGPSSKPYPRPVHPPRPYVEIVTMAQILETAAAAAGAGSPTATNFGDCDCCFLRVESARGLEIETAEETATMYNISLKKLV